MIRTGAPRPASSPPPALPGVAAPPTARESETSPISERDLSAVVAPPPRYATAPPPPSPSAFPVHDPVGDDLASPMTPHVPSDPRFSVPDLARFSEPPPPALPVFGALSERRHHASTPPASPSHARLAVSLGVVGLAMFAAYALRGRVAAEPPPSRLPAVSAVQPDAPRDRADRMPSPPAPPAVTSAARIEPRGSAGAAPSAALQAHEKDALGVENGRALRAATDAAGHAPSVDTTTAAGGAPDAALAASHDAAIFDARAAAGSLASLAAGASACVPSDDKGVLNTAHVVATFAPSGNLTEVTVDSPPYVGTPAGECLAQRLRAASVPPFVGEPVTVRKTLRLP